MIFNVIQCACIHLSSAVAVLDKFMFHLDRILLEFFCVLLRATEF